MHLDAVDGPRSLLDAVLAVQAATSLEAVLGTTAEQARRLLSAAGAGCGVGGGSRPTRYVRSPTARAGASSSERGASSPLRDRVRRDNRPHRSDEGGGWLGVPMRSRAGGDLGLLEVWGASSDGFGPASEQLLATLGRLASAPVEDALRLDDGRRRIQQLQDLMEASILIHSPRSLDRMLEQVTRAAADLIGARQAVTSLTVGDEGTQVVQSVHRAPGPDAVPDDEVTGVPEALRAEVCRTNRSVRLTQPQLEAWMADDEALVPPRGWLAAPLVDRDGNNLGLVHLVDKIGGDFTASDRSLLEQLAHVASVAIEKADLSERLARQEAARFREELLSGISHDMQTPLATIVGLTDLLVHDPDVGGEERRSIHRTIDRQARNLRALVQQFLDFSRLESDRPLVLRRRPSDVVASIDRIVALFSHQRDIVVGASQALPRADVDPDRLDQMLANLVSNAVKYSQAPVRVVARGESDEVVIDVVDEGAGIDDEDLERLFEKFHRGANATGTPGTGLGLYITRALVEAHGGQLQVHSNLDVGSRFQLRLPVATP